MSYALATESLHKPGVINQSLSGPVLLTAKTAHINPTSKEEKQVNGSIFLIQQPLLEYLFVAHGTVFNSKS